MIAYRLLQISRRVLQWNKKAELGLPQRWPRDAPYGFHEKFSLSLSIPTATFPKFLTGFCSDRSYEVWMRLQNLKFVALPISEIISKNGQSLDTPTLPFLQNF